MKNQNMPDVENNLNLKPGDIIAKISQIHDVRDEYEYIGIDPVNNEVIYRKLGLKKLSREKLENVILIKRKGLKFQAGDRIRVKSRRHRYSGITGVITKIHTSLTGIYYEVSLTRNTLCFMNDAVIIKCRAHTLVKI